MDSKLSNYSKLQIPVLNGVSSHNYVIMPALLSQIDSSISGAHQIMEDDLLSASNSNGYPSIYLSSNNNDNNDCNESNDIDIQTETVFITTHSPMASNNHKKSNRKLNRNLRKKSKFQLKKNSNKSDNFDANEFDNSHLLAYNDNDSTNLNDDIIDGISNGNNDTNCHNDADDVGIDECDDECGDDEVDNEDLGLNSKLISKFIYKETESLIDNFTNSELLNGNTIDSLTTSSEIITNNDNLNENNNGIDLQNDESVTYIVNCSLMPDIDLSQMMNCYVALNKINDDNIGKKLFESNNFFLM